jgi:hypothetical protein
MILKLQRLSALPLVKEIGADGVEVEMGGLGDRVTFDSRLGDPVVRRAFLDFLPMLSNVAAISPLSYARSGESASARSTPPTRMGSGSKTTPASTGGR